MWLIACIQAPVEEKETAEAEDTAEDTAGDTAVDTGTEPAVDCDALPEPTLIGQNRDVSASEDYAFSADGWVVHVTDAEDLVQEDGLGAKELLVPGVGMIAGTAFLPDGDLVVANVLTGSVERLGLDGARTVLASGFGYPNGLAVGPDGAVYVADQTAGRLRRVDPDGAWAETVAEGLNNPNGVAFGPDGSVYVGSFGGGVIYRLEPSEGAFALPQLYAGRAGSFAVNTDPCVTLSAGEACFRVGGLGPGVCAEGSAGLTCTQSPDEAACAALATGDSCETTLLGSPISSVCTELDGALACPAVDAERISACAASSMYGGCSYAEQEGYCNLSFEGVLACQTYDEAYDAYVLDCQARAEGDVCQVLDPLRPDDGVCADGTAWGYPGRLLCMPESTAAFGAGEGGFDAIGVDECGQLYVGEYITGTILRWPDGGEEPEEVITLDSAWIPNLHWGNGVAGWEKDHIYVMDRDGRGGLFDVDVGVGSGAP